MSSTYHDLGMFWKDLLLKGLEDDDWQSDWTSLGLNDKRVTARVFAKSEGIWASSGLNFALNQIAEEVLCKLDVRGKFADGEKFKRGDVVATWKGPARFVLAAERPYLNLAAFASGISTNTAKLQAIIEKEWRSVERSKYKLPRLTPTRKTLPLYRDLSVHAVMVGGGYSHRTSLSGGVLIKENHVTTAGSIEVAVKAAQSVAPHGLKIEVEVRSLEELKKAQKAGADGVLLDNFSPSEVRKAINYLREEDSKIFVEVSGGLTESNICDYVIPGVDVLSVGSLTHSVRAADFSLLVE